MANRYWEWEFVKGEKIGKDGKTTEANVAGKIEFHDPKSLAEKLEEAKKNSDEAEGELEAAKKARANAGDKSEEEMMEIMETCFSSAKRLDEEKKRVSAYEKIQSVIQNNPDMHFEVRRLKDRYSRKEGLAIDIIREGIQDGKIVTAIGLLDKDIFKLEEFGVYLSPQHYGALSKIIRENYFALAALEKDFIGNDVPEQALKRFAQICYEQIMEGMQKGDKGIEKDSTEKWYHVVPSMLETWYEESGFRTFKLASLKEALVIYGYAKANPGRNDLYVLNKGRRICMNVEKLNEMGVYKYDKE